MSPKTRVKNQPQSDGHSPDRGEYAEHLVRELEAAAAGAAAGAVAGAMAGPPGAIAGALLGAAAVAVAEDALENDQRVARAKDAQLDDDIGVTAGDIGAPNLKHPPARRGT
jgi:hypothetical protein